MLSQRGARMIMYACGKNVLEAKNLSMLDTSSSFTCVHTLGRSLITAHFQAVIRHFREWKIFEFICVLTLENAPTLVNFQVVPRLSQTPQIGPNTKGHITIRNLMVAHILGVQKSTRIQVH
jgi:hypothetical protein